MKPIDRVLPLLVNVRAPGDGYVAQCPAHDDENPSLSVSDGDDGRVLLYCHAGCSTESVLDALGMDWADLFSVEGGAEVEIASESLGCQSSQGRLRARGWFVPEDGADSFDDVDAIAQSRVSGCTLEAYSREKELPKSLLEELGVKNKKRNGRPVVEIPYFSPNGERIATRYRTGLRGPNRFQWKKGDKPDLYGLWRLADARKRDYVVLVEGESDAHTFWLHDIPALGLPGATQWSDERFLRHFTDITRVYLFIEKDAGGVALLKAMSESKIADRIDVVRFKDLHDYFKDPSALHVVFPDLFADLWRDEVEKARPIAEVVAEDGDQELRELWTQCAEIASARDVLSLFGRDLEAIGVAGEERASKLLYLAVTSRFLPRPVSLVLKGPSSAGKSFTTEQVLRFFPTSAAYALTAMSERALAYFSEPLKHRFLVVYEASGVQGDAEYFVRSLLSESQVRYVTVDRSGGQQNESREIIVEGPTGLIMTTTRIALHPENETRYLSIPVNDTPEQTRRVILSLADEDRDAIDVSHWLHFQEWIARSEHRVTIPYLHALLSLIPPLDVRLRRDATAVVNLIKAHAILHQATRDRDEPGRIVATVADYAVVHELVADLVASGIAATVPPAIRETVEAVADLASDDVDDIRGVQVVAVAKRLGLDNSTTSRRLKAATKAGYVENLAGRGRAAQYVPANPMPDDSEVLPSPRRLVGHGT